MIALPSQLFRTTQIPACLWFFLEQQGAAGEKALRDRRGDILFIDARTMGTMLDRTERILTDDDIAKIAGTYHAWRGTMSARQAGLKYEDIPGFCSFGDRGGGPQARPHPHPRPLRRCGRRTTRTSIQSPKD